MGRTLDVSPSGHLCLALIGQHNPPRTSLVASIKRVYGVLAGCWLRFLLHIYSLTLTSMPRLDRILIILMGAFFLVFAFPKLLPTDDSAALFDQINAFTGWTGSWFRIMTGVLELTVGAMLVIGGLMTKTPGPMLSPYGVFLLGAGGTVGTMLGALTVEIAVRPGEDIALLVLAFILLGLALFLLWRQRAHLPIVGTPRWS